MFAVITRAHVTSSGSGKKSATFSLLNSTTGHPDQFLYFVHVANTFSEHNWIWSEARSAICMTYMSGNLSSHLACGQAESRRVYDRLRVKRLSGFSTNIELTPEMVFKHARLSIVLLEQANESFRLIVTLSKSRLALRDLVRTELNWNHRSCLCLCAVLSQGDDRSL